MCDTTSCTVMLCEPRVCCSVQEVLWRADWYLLRLAWLLHGHVDSRVYRRAHCLCVRRWHTLQERAEV